MTKLAVGRLPRDREAQSLLTEYGTTLFTLVQLCHQASMNILVEFFSHVQLSLYCMVVYIINNGTGVVTRRQESSRPLHQVRRGKEC